MENTVSLLIKRVAYLEQNGVVIPGGGNTGDTSENIILLEDGTEILLEDGTPLLLEEDNSGSNTEITNGILLEDNTHILLENNNPLLLE